jgi:hypothetical protein
MRDGDTNIFLTGRQALGCSLFDNKNWCGGRRMAGGRPPSFISFTCAHCQALYHVVKVEAGPETTEAEVTCRACGAPLPGREGTFVLKYFYAAPRSARSAPWTGQDRRTSRGHNLALVLNPCALRRRPTAGAVLATRAAASMQCSDRCRRRCGRGTWACRRTGSAARMAAATWQASITKKGLGGDRGRPEGRKNTALSR